MILLHPMWLVLLLLLPLPWLYLRRKDYLGYSDVRLVDGARGNRFLQSVPPALITIALALLVVCLARPQVRQEDATQTVKSRDIIFAVDISGSMTSKFEGEIPKPEKGNADLDKDLPPLPAKRAGDSGYSSGNSPDPDAGKRRIDAAQSAVTRFVRARYLRGEGDRIGIMVFDTEPHWSWPLTDDLKMIYRKGLFISEGIGGGTNFGDRDPGPIDAAAAHIDERGQAATRVLIIVTDGEDSIGYKAMERLVQKLQERHIRLYVIGVGETLAHRDVDIIRLAEAVGGQVFRVENAQDMARCFDSIDQMERSPVEVQTHTSYQDVFFYFAAAALGFLFLGALSEVVIVRQ